MTTGLGLEAGVVRLVAYDPVWPELFAVEAERIAASVRACGAPPLVLEHVGSTAIPGLAAKPVLDLLAGHRADVPATTYIEALTAVGYLYRGDRGLPGREFFRRGDPRSHHVHLTAVGGPHWRDYLVFRDALRADAGLAAAYGELKAALAARHPRDREAYIAGKTAFVRRVLATGAARPVSPRRKREASRSATAPWRDLDRRRVPGDQMQISNVIAQLRTTDLAASIRFYTALPGFTLAFQHEDFYAGIRAGAQLFHLKLVDAKDPSIDVVAREEHLHLYFQTSDVNAAADACRRAGVPLARDVHDTPWGTREFVIRDDQGHTLYFGEAQAGAAGEA